MSGFERDIATDAVADEPKPCVGMHALIVVQHRTEAGAGRTEIPGTCIAVVIKRLPLARTIYSATGIAEK